jgi:uncharacterized membrane protein YbhN (UPF0104 family)
MAPEPATLSVEGEPTPARRPRRSVALSALAGTVIAVACIAFVIARMSAQWAEVGDDIAGAEPAWIAAAALAATAAMAWIASCWQRVLALFGPAPPRGRTMAWYFAGEIGKYVPGTVWPVLGRGELARRGGVPRHRAYPSVALSLAALYLAALALATALVPPDLAKQSESPAALALLALLPVGLLSLHPRVLTAARDLLVRFTGRGADIVVPPWRATVGVVASYLPAWLGIWAATWCVARALDPDAPLLRIGIATALSWTAGFVAVPVPAGAGVREAVFVAASGLPLGLGATVAVGSRLIFLLVDVTGAGVAALQASTTVSSRTRRPGRSPGS